MPSVPQRDRSHPNHLLLQLPLLAVSASTLQSASLMAAIRKSHSQKSLPAEQDFDRSPALIQQQQEQERQRTAGRGHLRRKCCARGHGGRWKQKKKKKLKCGPARRCGSETAPRPLFPSPPKLTCCGHWAPGLRRRRRLEQPTVPMPMGSASGQGVWKMSRLVAPSRSSCALLHRQ